MINFIVVDDNDKHRKKNVKFILDYMMKNNLDFDIHEYNDYSDKLISDIEKFGDSSIYVIDLELPSGDGLDIARTIRNEYNNWVSPIVIITCHTSLYYEVYKQRLQILDFIGKCEDIRNNLSKCIDICLKMLNKDKFYRYTYKSVDYQKLIIFKEMVEKQRLLQVNVNIIKIFQLIRLKSYYLIVLLFLLKGY